MTRLMKMNADEWPYIVIGCIMALAQGAVQPAFALIFAIMLGVSDEHGPMLFVASWCVRNVSDFCSYVWSSPYCYTHLKPGLSQ